VKEIFEAAEINIFCVLAGEFGEIINPEYGAGEEIYMGKTSVLVDDEIIEDAIKSL
jgi:hypothetical protein